MKTKKIIGIILIVPAVIVIALLIFVLVNAVLFIIQEPIYLIPRGIIFIAILIAFGGIYGLHLYFEVPIRPPEQRKIKEWVK